MPRKFLDTIKTAIDAQMADNSVGAITPAILRNTLTDIIDSTINQECVIYTTTPELAFPITPTATAIDFFTDTIGGDGVFLKPNDVAGEIVLNTVAGYKYEIVLQITVEDANNREIEASFLVDGVKSVFTSSITGRGAGKPFTISLSSFIYPSVSNSVVQLGLAANSAVSVAVLGAVLQICILPTEA